MGGRTLKEAEVICRHTPGSLGRVLPFQFTDYIMFDTFLPTQRAIQVSAVLDSYVIRAHISSDL